MDRSADEVLGRAPIGFLHLDSALCCVQLNSWLAAAYGVAADDAAGRRLHELAPSVAAAAAEDLKRLLDGGSPVRITLPIDLAGDTAFYQHHFAPVRGADGWVQGIDVFVCNVEAPRCARKAPRPQDAPAAREGAKRVPSKLVRPGHGGCSAGDAATRSG